MVLPIFDFKGLVLVHSIYFSGRGTLVGGVELDRHA